MAFLRDKSVYCIPGTTFKEHQKYIIGGICIATSSVGFLGAGLQLKSLWQYRDRQRRRPSVNPRIIFYLALSDLVACVGMYLNISFLSFLFSMKIDFSDGDKGRFRIQSRPDYTTTLNVELHQVKHMPRYPLFLCSLKTKKMCTNPSLNLNPDPYPKPNPNSNANRSPSIYTHFLTSHAQLVRRLRNDGKVDATSTGSLQLPCDITAHDFGAVDVLVVVDPTSFSLF